MELRDFGRLGQISALTLGGGGIGGVWGRTDRREAIATVHAALDAGITMLDLAPSYGDAFESEVATADALRGHNSDVMITSKVRIPDDVRDLTAHIRGSLYASLTRLGRGHLDLFVLHTPIRRAGTTHPHTVSPGAYREEIVPTFEALRNEGLIRAWGITAVGDTVPLVDAFHPGSPGTAPLPNALHPGSSDDAPRPDAAQVVVNALDQTGDLWSLGDEVRPDNAAVLRAASTAGVPVSAIRVVAAGSLTSSLDRDVPPGHPAAVDFARAEPFRKLAAELGETPASLAHRYALSVPGVSTVILGVKNRTELSECLTAEARGPLSPTELQAIAAL